MEGAKVAAEPPAGGQLESALLHIMQQHHHQTLRQGQQTGNNQPAISSNSPNLPRRRPRGGRRPNLLSLTTPHAERAKKNALRSASRVAGHLADAVDGGVQELFVNEKRIELEARALLATIARYRKQTDQWLAATNAVNSVIKVCILCL